ncbi:hypothetical protein, partial [Endozoicomonas sp. YOMI1]|uniref:hypothetical protein n=1 Tax=Endozoicomonas sp. YOMI1 TaxID=2828739 RepID=UPI002147EAA8
SDKGKASRARYLSSDKGKASKARYAASDKGKASQALRSEKSKAYRSALKQGLSEELARKKGELAANAKKAKLSSVYPSLFQPQNEEILTHGFIR